MALTWIWTRGKQRRSCDRLCFPPPAWRCNRGRKKRTLQRVGIKFHQFPACGKCVSRACVHASECFEKSFFMCMFAQIIVVSLRCWSVKFTEESLHLYLYQLVLWGSASLDISQFVGPGLSQTLVGRWEKAAQGLWRHRRATTSQAVRV